MDKIEYNNFFYVLTKNLSKSQHQFKLTIAVGGYRFFFSKDIIISITLVCFIVINGLIQKYYEKQLLQIYFIDINCYNNFFYKKTHYILLFFN